MQFFCRSIFSWEEPDDWEDCHSSVFDTKQSTPHEESIEEDTTKNDLEPNSIIGEDTVETDNSDPNASKDALEIDGKDDETDSSSQSASALSSSKKEKTPHQSK